MLKRYRVWNTETMRYENHTVKSSGEIEGLEDGYLVEEWTHATDQNGKYIFEHDVLKNIETGEELGIVAFDYDDMRWKLKSACKFVPLSDYAKKSKVVGTSHDKKFEELLGKMIIMEDISFMTDLSFETKKDTVLNEKILERIKFCFDIREDIQFIKTLGEIIDYIFVKENRKCLKPSL